MCKLPGHSIDHMLSFDSLLLGIVSNEASHREVRNIDGTYLVQMQYCSSEASVSDTELENTHIPIQSVIFLQEAATTCT
jgi:hypothetical protein